MASTPEGKVKAKVKALLKRHAVYAHWPVQAGYGSPCLDCNGCKNGIRFDIETKAPGKKLTARQKLTKADIEAAGGVVFVIGEHHDPVTNNYSGMDALEAWLSST